MRADIMGDDSTWVEPGIEERAERKARAALPVGTPVSDVNVFAAVIALAELVGATTVRIEALEREVGRLNQRLTLSIGIDEDRIVALERKIEQLTAVPIGIVEATRAATPAEFDDFRERWSAGGQQGTR